MWMWPDSKPLTVHFDLSRNEKGQEELGQRDPPSGGIGKYRKEGMITLRSWNSTVFLRRTVSQGQTSQGQRGKAFGAVGFSASSCSRKQGEEIVGPVP